MSFTNILKEESFLLFSFLFLSSTLISFLLFLFPLLSSSLISFLLFPFPLLSSSLPLFFNFLYAQSAGGCRIHRLLLCRGVRPPPNECPGYDSKQSDGEVPAMIKLWGMWSTSLLPSFPGPLWLKVVALDKGPIYGLNRTKRWLAFTVFIHLNCVFMLNWIV